MAATVHTAPPAIAYNREPIPLRIETDRIVLNYAFITFEIAGTGPNVADALMIAWSGQSVNFQVNTPDPENAFIWPVKEVGESLSDYADRVTEAFRQCEAITIEWNVLRGASGATEFVGLRYKLAQALAPNVSHSLTNVTVTITDAVASTDVDNLRCYVQLWQVGATANDDTQIVALHAPYNADTIAEFDLRELFPVSPHLPATTSIDPSIILEWPHGEATTALCRAFFRYADKYGSPAQSDALLRSESDFFVLAGGRATGRIPASIGGYSLPAHDYYREDGEPARKPVRLEQPDWLYAFTNFAFTDCRVELALTWSDGTETTEAGDGSAFDLDAQKLYWFASGPLQHRLHLLTPPAEGLMLASYDWNLYGTLDTDEFMVAQVRYDVSCEKHPWNLYLAYENAAGGIETAWLRGKRREKYEAGRDTARHPAWIEHDLSADGLASFNTAAAPVWEVNTGWQPQWYLRHLRQIITAEALWVVDVPNKRFLKVVCETSEILDYEDDGELFAAELTLRAAWSDPGYTVL